ncbi:hypothetical protein ACJJTC_019670 [Scirpophaga incertulas]
MDPTSVAAQLLENNFALETPEGQKAMLKKAAASIMDAILSQLKLITPVIPQITVTTPPPRPRLRQTREHPRQPALPRLAEHPRLPEHPPRPRPQPLLASFLANPRTPLQPANPPRPRPHPHSLDDPRVNHPTPSNRSRSRSNNKRAASPTPPSTGNDTAVHLSDASDSGFTLALSRKKKRPRQAESPNRPAPSPMDTTPRTRAGPGGRENNPELNLRFPPEPLSWRQRPTQPNPQPNPQPSQPPQSGYSAADDLRLLREAARAINMKEVRLVAIKLPQIPFVNINTEGEEPSAPHTLTAAANGPEGPVQRRSRRGGKGRKKQAATTTPSTEPAPSASLTQPSAGLIKTGRQQLRPTTQASIETVQEVPSTPPVVAASTKRTKAKPAAVEKEPTSAEQVTGLEELAQLLKDLCVAAMQGESLTSLIT